MAGDLIQRFIFDNTPVRGEIVQLDETYRQIIEKNDYPVPVARVLGDLLAACALLTATVKLDGTLSIEIRGNGPVHLFMTESSPGTQSPAQQLRGIARFDASTCPDAATAPLAELAGNKGRIVITMTPREGRRYQGIVPLDKPTVAGCMETYFAQSEQLPTRLWLAGDTTRIAGLLLQQLPGEQTANDTDAWDRLSHLADTITADEMIRLPTQEMLHRLFHEEDLRVWSPAPVVFSCTCSRERFARALHQLGAEQLRDILEEQKQIETQCHFCNTIHRFTAADVEALIDDPDQPSPTLQ